MIAPALPEQIPALKKLWKACFLDHDSYVEFIFNEWQRDMLVLSEEGEPVSMLSVQEFDLYLSGAAIPAAYIYAVATAPERQGKGLGAELLRQANKILRERGRRCSALVPASERLFGYYGRLGYENAFRLRFAEVSAAELAPCAGWSAEESDFPAVYEYMERFYSGRDAALWPRDYLAFVGNESRYYGGGVLLLRRNGAAAGYAVGYRIGSLCLVKELAVPPEDIPGALAAVHAVFGAGSYRLYLPPDSGATFTNRFLPFGMIQWYDNSDRPERPVCAYLTHALD